MTTDITELAQSLKAAAEKATQGEWWADEVKNEGCYGSGDDCVEGFTSYAIYGSDGQTLFDSLNSDAACICEEYDGEGHVAWDETAQRNAEFITLANPANVLALVEELEKAQQHIARQEQILLNQDESLSIRRGELEAAQQERDNWLTSFENERFRADKLKTYIDDIEPIRAAAEKLVHCKGRYHSEQNYRSLAALFGVNTPDLPPLDGDSRTVTVKLPESFKLAKSSSGLRYYYADEVDAALTAAGIKVEDE
ncbi:TPA: ead/Ea22-like family protein [Klebsiella michiganensis]|nr:ead/Ea22-like family protein [Klebsiella pneumoniae]HDS8777987.1 ead/Ea22-like family protein [Klebsiella michiganensis]